LLNPAICVFGAKEVTFQPKVLGPWKRKSRQ
jgi:hypothetical protein